MASNSLEIKTERRFHQVQILIITLRSDLTPEDHVAVNRIS